MVDTCWPKHTVYITEVVSLVKILGQGKLPIDVTGYAVVILFLVI